MLHELKTWPEPFEAMARGEKTHEIRKADRPFAVGDMLRLREWTPGTGTYTGRELFAEITYVSAPGTWGLPPDMCVLSLGREQLLIQDQH